jgi:hypothetical protein
MTVYSVSITCYWAGSLPFESHEGAWEGPGEDGSEPAPHFSIHIKAIIRMTSSIKRTWMPRELVPPGPGAEGSIQAA